MNPLVAPWRPVSRLAGWMVGASARFNYEWALRRPGRPPFIMLTEFPRSGGNWIRDVLADTLQLPAPRFNRVPALFPCIAHNHDPRPLLSHPCIYVMRDPRDIFLSHRAKVWTTFQSAGPAGRQRALKRHPSLRRADPSSDGPDMTAFYAEWLERPLGSRVGWGTHVAPWLDNPNPQLALIRFEDMHERAETTVRAAVERLAGHPPEDFVIDFAIQRNSFEAQTGRKPGEVDSSSTKRQGLAGAWRKNLPPALAGRFMQDLGTIIEKAGYADA